MLTLDPIVQVNVNVGSASSVGSVFNIGAILGPSTVLNATSRFATYANAQALLTAGFQDTDPEYVAALKYFSVSPAPSKVVVIFYDASNGSTETPVTALTDAISKGAEFYGLYYCPVSGATAAAIKTNIVAIDTYLNTLDRYMQFAGVTGTATEVTVADGTLDTLYQAATERTIIMKCKTAASDAAALMGLAMGLALKYEEGSFAIAHKAIASATVDDTLTQANIDTIKAKNGNVYVPRTKKHNCFENGATPSGLRFDEVLYLDRIAHDLQEACFDLIAEHPQKLPLSDTSTALFYSQISSVLEAYFNAGVLATSTWRGANIVDVSTGDTIEHGYHCYADSYDLQTDADRLARKAMPITVLLCLTGSVETIVLNLNVQT